MNSEKSGVKKSGSGVLQSDICVATQDLTPEVPTRHAPAEAHLQAYSVAVKTGSVARDLPVYAQGCGR